MSTQPDPTKAALLDVAQARIDVLKAGLQPNPMSAAIIACKVTLDPPPPLTLAACANCGKGIDLSTQRVVNDQGTDSVFCSWACSVGPESLTVDDLIASARPKDWPLPPAADLDENESRHWSDMRDLRLHLHASRILIRSATMARRQGGGPWWDDQKALSRLADVVAELPDMPESSAGIMPPSTVAEPEGAEGIGS